MTYDPAVPARERTPFGNFELRSSHLQTATIRVPFSDEVISDEVRREASLVVCGHVADAQEATMLLEALGLHPGCDEADTARMAQGCGTRAGYQRHKAIGAQPCEPCRQAHNAYMREYLRRRGAAKRATA